MTNEDRWCFGWLPAPSNVDTTKAALAKNYMWTSSQTIEVAFLDGDQELRDMVEQVAQEWTGTGMADLKLAFRKNTTNTPIRISFKYSGSWSMIGTSCRQVTDTTKPTMNYGWITKDSDVAEIRRVVLHEFGHALGMIHEHQNPSGAIVWNRDQVIKDLQASQGWSLDDIENNVFRPWSKAETNFTALDKKSIMLYPIPKSWTTNGFSSGLNTDLSPTDRKFIASQYG